MNSHGLKNSLRYKLVAATIIVELIMLALLLGNSIRLVNNSIEYQTRKQIETIIPLLNASTSTSLFERDYVTLSDTLAALIASQDTDFTYIRIYDKQGVLYAEAGQPNLKNLPDIDRDIQSAFSDHVYDGSSPLSLAGMDIGTVRYGLSIKSFLDSKDMLFNQGLLIAAAEILLSILLLGFIGYWLTRHLGILLQATSAISKGNYAVHAEIDSKDEIGQLAGEFNIMAQAVNDKVLDLKRSQNQLEKSRAAFESVIMSMADAAIFLDLEFRCVLVNHAFFTLFGHRKDAILNNTVDKLFADNTEYHQLINHISHPGNTDYYKSPCAVFVKQNGDNFEGETSASRVISTHHKALGYILIIRDITERNRINQILISEKERIQVTLESIGDGVITTNLHGEVTYLNPVAEQLTGWSREQAINMPLKDVFNIVNEHTRQAVADSAQQCLNEGRAIELSKNVLLINKNGAEFSIQDSASPIRNSDGEIYGVVMVFHDVTKSSQLSRNLDWQASHDSLTNLYNRHEFEQRLKNALQEAKDDDVVHSLLYIDLDQFKIVNDTCGHIAGDELLRQVALLLQKKIRDIDTFARLGGDEFGVLLEHCDIDRAEIIANNLKTILEDFKFSWDDKTFSIGMSVGLVPVTSQSENITSILKLADIACYAAKDSGRNRIHVYKPDDTELARRQGEMQWVGRINHALENDRFCIYCQPIVPLQTRASSTVHYEILVRLLDDDDSLISPMAFIPAAERYNLMPGLDLKIIQTVFRMLEAQPLEKGIITINLSGHTLTDDACLQNILNLLKNSPVTTNRICFEITETAAIANLGRALYFMEEIKSMGCCFALDDFGSGLSSFSYLKNLPVDYLKIDGVFVRDICNDPVDLAMVQSINQLGHVLNIKTIAEYVENDDIRNKITQIGIDYAQGFGIEKPRPFSEVLSSSSADKNIIHIAFDSK
jgi:diguanylate cyclase (GGDEF)-like protein/PAS domain S-box-containing protein